MVMTRNLLVLVVALAIGGCGAEEPLPTPSASESAPVRGGILWPDGGQAVETAQQTASATATATTAPVASATVTATATATASKTAYQDAGAVDSRPAQTDAGAVDSMPAVDATPAVDTAKGAGSACDLIAQDCPAGLGCYDLVLDNANRRVGKCQPFSSHSAGTEACSTADVFTCPAGQFCARAGGSSKSMACWRFCAAGPAGQPAVSCQVGTETRMCDPVGGVGPLGYCH